MVHTKKAEMEGIAEIDWGTEKGYDLGIQMGTGETQNKRRTIMFPITYTWGPSF